MPMIRKNRRELNSYSPSKYLVCRKISKKLVRYYVHKLFFVDGGRAQFGKMYGTWENLDYEYAGLVLFG